MKIYWLRYLLISASLIFIVAMSACNPMSVPTLSDEIVPSKIPPQAVLEAVNQLSQEVNVSVDEIQILEFERVDWPDACLGIEQAEQACAQVVTPGFRVVLEVNGQPYEFRSNEDGTVVMKVPEA